MSLKKIIGAIPFYTGGQDAGSATAPSIKEFKWTTSSDSLNELILSFSVSDFKSIILYSEILNDDGVVIGEQQSIDVTNNNASPYRILRDKTYKTRTWIEATNDNGSTSSEKAILDKAIKELEVLDVSAVPSYSIEKVTDSFDRVNVSLTIAASEKYTSANIKSITLLSKRADFSTWFTSNLSVSIFEEVKDNQVLTGYKFSFNNFKFPRTSLGGFFQFQIKISIEGFTDLYTNISRIYFDTLSVTQSNTQSSNTFPKAEITDKFTSLRYEVDAKLYQFFALITDLRYEPSVDTDKQEESFVYRFLDPKDVAELNYSDQLIQSSDGSYLFYYEFNNSKTDSSTKGFMYPASVSEIYPCLAPERDADQNTSIVFFWKISDDFYDYSYFKNAVSVYTTELQVKLQYKSNGSYVDLTLPISLVKEKYFQDSSKKFIVQINRDIDVIAANRSLFDKILESDNANENVRFLVVSHSVLCSTSYGAKAYTFEKMLLPPRWKYIAYDKYIPKDALSRKSEKIEVTLSNYCFRGIRLPDKGFKTFDKIDDIRQLSTSRAGSYTAIFDLSIIYKLACVFNGFYQDPIIEGTVNSITLPEIPDDVFIIPPTISVPQPNLIPISNGGRQAEAMVNLNEYGKIRAVELIDPGGGYSLYNTALKKRQQTFSDFTPAVITSYTVNSTPQIIQKDFLVPKNILFDSANLKASMRGGVRLNSVQEDSRAMGDSLTQLQKQNLNEYLSEDLVVQNTEVENSYSLYYEDNPSIERFQDIFDYDWYLISQLYEDKYNNPMDEVSVYNEDVDAAISDQTDSSVTSNIVSNEQAQSFTPTSVAIGSPQTSQDGGAYSYFALNNLVVVPDSSPAVSVSAIQRSTPWLTLLPLAVRSDGERGSGPLPNMQTRAEMFNRIAAAVNNLNEVRVILPFIWLATQNVTNWRLITPTSSSSFSEITFSKSGTIIENNSLESDFIAPINTSFVSSASRSVSKTEYKSSDLEGFNLPAGIYAVSAEDSSSVTFNPKLHPMMSNAAPEYILKSLKRRILGYVTKGSYNCSSTQAPISQSLGVPFLACGTANGNVFERPIESSSYPDVTFTTDSYFDFFDAGGAISSTPRGSARYIGIQIERRNGSAYFCSASCGDSDFESVDFVYTNMFPATYKI